MIPNDKAFNGKSFFEDNGTIFYRFIRIEKKGNYQLRFKFIKVNSLYKQGIAIGFSKNPVFKGSIHLNGERLEKAKKRVNYVIEEGMFPNNEFTLSIQNEEEFITLSGASDFLGDYSGLLDKVSKLTGKSQLENKSFTSGVTAANMYGNAFWIEVISDKCYRFHCNDHELDDDFDDLVFEFEVICFNDR